MYNVKQLITTMAAVVVLASVSATSFAETTMEKIVKTGKMTIAVQTQGPPVSFINKDGKRTGLAIELAQMMADDMSVELVIQDYDWKGLIPALTSGKADFIAADMTPTAKRHMQIVFTNPVFYAETIAFAKADKGFNSYTDLNKDGVSVGTTQASSFSGTARKILSSSYPFGSPPQWHCVFEFVCRRVGRFLQPTLSISEPIVRRYLLSHGCLVLNTNNAKK